MEAWRRQVGRAAYVAATITNEMNTAVSRIYNLQSNIRIWRSIGGTDFTNDVQIIDAFCVTGVYFTGGEYENLIKEINIIIQNTLQTEQSLKRISAPTNQIFMLGDYAPKIHRLKYSCGYALYAISQSLHDGSLFIEKRFSRIASGVVKNKVDLDITNINMIMKNKPDVWCKEIKYAVNLIYLPLDDMTAGIQNIMNILDETVNHPFFDQNNKQIVDTKKNISLIRPVLLNIQKQRKMAIDAVENYVRDHILPETIETMHSHILQGVARYISHRNRDDVKYIADISHHAGEIKRLFGITDVSKYEPQIIYHINNYIQAHGHPLDEHFDIEQYLNGFSTIVQSQTKFTGISIIGHRQPVSDTVIDFRGAFLHPGVIARLMNLLWTSSRGRYTGNERYSWLENIFSPANNLILKYVFHKSDLSVLTLCRRIAISLGARIVPDADVGTDKEIAAANAIMKPYTDEIAAMYTNNRENWPSRYRAPAEPV